MTTGLDARAQRLAAVPAIQVESVVPSRLDSACGGALVWHGGLVVLFLLLISFPLVLIFPEGAGEGQRFNSALEGTTLTFLASFFRTCGMGIVSPKQGSSSRVS